MMWHHKNLRKLEPQPPNKIRKTCSKRRSSKAIRYPMSHWPLIWIYLPNPDFQNKVKPTYPPGPPRYSLVISVNPCVKNQLINDALRNNKHCIVEQCTSSAAQPW